MIYDLYTKIIVNFFSIKGRYFLIQASVTTSDLVNHYAVLILHWFYNYYFSNSSDKAKSTLSILVIFLINC